MLSRLAKRRDETAIIKDAGRDHFENIVILRLQFETKREFQYFKISRRDRTRREFSSRLAEKLDETVNFKTNRGLF